MKIKREIIDDNVLLLYGNGRLMYKRNLQTGTFDVFDCEVYGDYKNLSVSEIDIEGNSKYIYVLAILKLFTPEEGGRQNSIMSGYRPNHVFEYDDNGDWSTAFMGDFQFGDNESIQPGNTQMVIVRFLAQQVIDRYLNIGRTWNIYEGAQRVGEAEMLEISLEELYF